MHPRDVLAPDVARLWLTSDEDTWRCLGIRLAERALEPDGSGGVPPALKLGSLAQALLGLKKVPEELREAFEQHLGCLESFRAWGATHPFDDDAARACHFWRLIEGERRAVAAALEAVHMGQRDTIQRHADGRCTCRFFDCAYIAAAQKKAGHTEAA